MEMVKRLLVLAIVLAGPSAIRAEGPAEIVHAGAFGEFETSGPSIAIDGSGKAVVAWLRKDADGISVVCGSPGRSPVRVNPADMPAESVHAPPSLAAGADGTLYLAWSSPRKQAPQGSFASDLRLSRSSDGGATWEGQVRVSPDTDFGHSFEGMTVLPDGTVAVAWLDGRDGWDKVSTWRVLVKEKGTKVGADARVDLVTCSCCRVAAAAGGNGRVAFLFRDQEKGDVRDMVVALSDDGGETLRRILVHEDGWSFPGCPHRGGAVAIDRDGAVFTAWYTEGRDEFPRLRFAACLDGKTFLPPVELRENKGSIPDHVRIATDGPGKAAVVWLEGTAVRQRVLLRRTADAGRTFSDPVVLSEGPKASAPSLVALPSGDFVAAWDEIRWPTLVTIVREFRQEPPK
jgi:hypothetical protein